VAVVVDSGEVDLGIIRDLIIGGKALGTLEEDIGEDIMMDIREGIFIKISSSITDRESLITINSKSVFKEGTTRNNQDITRIMDIRQDNIYINNPNIHTNQGNMQFNQLITCNQAKCPNLTTHP
jgi:hypothetical protein